MCEVKIKLPIPGQSSEVLSRVIQRFNDGGFECYIIGGSVRDLLLKRDVYDYDLATSARPEQVKKLFRRMVPTGIKHGTVTVLYEDHSFEVTTYRADGKYIDGRRPETVTFSDTLKEDILRRDFTINGLAYDLNKKIVIDYVRGMEDIKKGIIRTIGSPEERFSEDGLRPYRACRFAAKLGFVIEEKTFQAIAKTHHVAQKVSIERVRDEFKKILETKKPSTGIEYLRESGLLQLFFPELAQCHEVEQNRFHRYDVYYHSLYSCDAVPPEHFTVRLAALLHDIGKVPTRRMSDNGDYTFYNHEVIGAKMARKWMKKMKFSNDEVDHVNNLVLNHMFHYTREWTDGAVRRFMRKVGVENLDHIFLLREADRKGNGSRVGNPAPIIKFKKRIKRIIEEENAITVKDLDINGNVLMDHFGLSPGPVIGSILNQLLEMVLDNPETNKQEILLDKTREILKANN